MPIRRYPRYVVKAARRIEVAAQQIQGKGWGTATVSAEVRAIASLLGTYAKADIVLADVGANSGWWSHAALREFPHATVHAVEASTTAYSELQRNLGGERRLVCHHLALGARDGVATLYADEPGSGLASLTQRSLDHVGRSMAPIEAVETRTLGSWRASAGISRLDVLKLDVEGHEWDVLLGARDALSDVMVVQFEFGGCNIDTRSFFKDFWYLFSEAGFQLWRLGPLGVVPVDRYRESDEAFRTTNFFATRIGGRDGSE